MALQTREDREAVAAGAEEGAGGEGGVGEGGGVRAGLSLYHLISTISNRTRHIERIIIA
jgi:hypothetical protein